MENGSVTVYYMQIPEGDSFCELYPKERMNEISSVRNNRLKREKYHVWKLLEYAVKRSFGREMSELNFTKSPYGKWECDGLCFSLSHTDGAVAVAVSGADVGVDIEKVSRRPMRVAKKVFCESEKTELSALCDDDALEYATRIWTAKESVFKTQNERAFSPQNICVSDYETSSQAVELDGEKYLISVAGEGAEKAKFYRK